MIVDVDGVAVHASTGGVNGESTNPVVLFLHGAGMDSTVWQLQTRYLAYRGFRAVAIDLPAHGRSGGQPLHSVEAMAQWVRRFAEVAGYSELHLVGHSMGTFVALEVARHQPTLVRSLTLCGTATGMPVHPDLLAAAANDLPAAAALMASWGHDKPSHVGKHPTPGLWMLGGAQALVENSRPGVLATDFAACMAYADALSAAAEVRCATTVVIGLGDKMTPAKGGRALAAAVANAQVVELAGTGHMMMTENPRAIQQAILATAKR